MLDSVEEIITSTASPELFNVLKLYEQSYEPDIGLIRPDGGQVFDLHTVGGDIKLYGFYDNASLDSITALATQDVLLRLFIKSEDSIFIDNFGLGLLSNIKELSPTIVETLIRVALTNSPYIGSIGDVVVSENINNSINVEFSAQTITNDLINFNEVVIDG